MELKLNQYLHGIIQDIVVGVVILGLVTSCVYNCDRSAQRKHEIHMIEMQQNGGAK